MSCLSFVWEMVVVRAVCCLLFVRETLVVCLLLLTFCQVPRMKRRGASGVSSGGFPHLAWVGGTFLPKVSSTQSLECQTLRIGDWRLWTVRLGPRRSFAQGKWSFQGDSLAGSMRGSFSGIATPDRATSRSGRAVI